MTEDVLNTVKIPAWNQILGGVVVIGGIFLYIKEKR